MFCELCPTNYPKQPSLNRILGTPVGISLERWPRFEGCPMQHLMTLDLTTVPVNIPGSKGYRAVLVFISSLIDNDANVSGSGETRVLWITQDEIDLYGESNPPDDWIQEAVESGSSTFKVENAVDEPEFPSENYLGGNPQWEAYSGEPDQLPNGEFIMRLSSLDFPFLPFDAYLYVFEDDAFWQPYEYSAVPPAWRDLEQIAFQLDILNGQLPDTGVLDRYGGLPPCGHMFEWPINDNDQPLLHVMTLDASRFTYVSPEGDRKPLDEDILAIALFYDSNRQGAWGNHTPYRLIFLSDRALDQQYPLQPPEELTVLPEAKIDYKHCDTTQSRSALSKLSLVSPRPAWRVLDRYPRLESFILQIAAEHLPGSPEEGTLYLYQWYDAIWQGVSDLPRQPGDWDNDDNAFLFTESFGESLSNQKLDGLREQIRILSSGNGEAGYFGGLPIGIVPEDWPTYQGQPMTHVLTLYTSTIPGLRDRPYSGIAIFLSSAWEHQAFFPDNEHSTIIRLSQTDISSEECLAPQDAEILPKKLLQAQLMPENMDIDALSQNSFAGGGPIWLQEANGNSEGFVMQLNDDIADINLADSGTLYVYENTAWIQSL